MAEVERTRRRIERQEIRELAGNEIMESPPTQNGLQGPVTPASPPSWLEVQTLQPCPRPAGS